MGPVTVEEYLYANGPPSRFRIVLDRAVPEDGTFTDNMAPMKSKAPPMPQTVMEAILEHREAGRQMYKKAKAKAGEEFSQFEHPGLYSMKGKIDQHNEKLALIRYHDSPSSCACTTCVTYFTPIDTQKTSDIQIYTSIVDDDQATKRLAKLVEEAEEHRTWLTERLETHGNDILKAWGKKNDRQRQACLPPKLQQQKYSSIRFLHEDKPWPEKRANWRQSLLLPHLNAESLFKESYRLLALVANRSSHEPWATSFSFSVRWRWWQSSTGFRMLGSLGSTATVHVHLDTRDAVASQPTMHERGVP